MIPHTCITGGVKGWEFYFVSRAEEDEKCQIGLDAFKRKANQVQKHNIIISTSCANVCGLCITIAKTIQKWRLVIRYRLFLRLL